MNESDSSHRSLILDKGGCMDFRRRKALLLDGNEHNRMLLGYAMAMGRIDYDEAETSEQAWQSWQPDAYTFVFIDADDHALEPFDLIRQIRKADPNIAIILLSINDDSTTVRRAVEAGCDLIIIKPFQMDIVMTLMKIVTATALRTAPEVLVITDRSNPRWEARDIRPR